MLCLLFCVFLTVFCFYETFVIQQKANLDTDAVKSVYVEYRFVISKINNNDDSNNEYELPLIRWFSSNGQTTATTQTKPGRQFSAGLFIPDSMADP